MAQEVVSGAEVRLVRDEDQGLYLVQIGVPGAHRTFASFKLGKMDQLREQAAAQAADNSAQPSQ